VVNGLLRTDTARAAITSRRADTATFAINARRADTATFAINARRADTATFAINARRADTATFAIKARRADTATYALRADTANFAWKARRADTAQFTWSADSARKAIFAFNAQTAVTAQTALTALDDLDKDPANEIQSLSLTGNTLTLSNPRGPASTVNLTTHAFRAPGASIEYPLGIIGEAVIVTTNYNVPTGKTFFISVVNTTVELSDGKVLYAEPGMPIIPENTLITTCYCTGILLANEGYISPLVLDFTNPSYEYTVPIGKTLILKSGKTSGGRLDLQIENDNFNFYTTGNQSPRLIVVTGGKRIKKPITLIPTDKLVLTGYLLSN
jgi:hypothetical protein